MSGVDDSLIEALRAAVEQYEQMHTNAVPLHAAARALVDAWDARPVARPDTVVVPADALGAAVAIPVASTADGLALYESRRAASGTADSPDATPQAETVSVPRAEWDALVAVSGHGYRDTHVAMKAHALIHAVTVAAPSTAAEDERRWTAEVRPHPYSPTSAILDILDHECHRWSSVTLTPKQARSLAAQINGAAHLVPEADAPATVDKFAAVKALPQWATYEQAMTDYENAATGMSVQTGRALESAGLDVLEALVALPVPETDGPTT